MPPSDSQKSQPNLSSPSLKSTPTGRTSIGRSLVIKGEISGAESLQIDGRIEGSIDLADQSVTVGAQGNVAANISAREVVVLGKVQGNIECTERVEIRSAGSVTGDVVTHRITVEDGAVLRGGVQIRAVEKKSDKSQQAQAATQQASRESAREEFAQAEPVTTDAVSTEPSWTEPAKNAAEQPRAFAAAAGAGAQNSVAPARRPVSSDFPERAGKLIKAGYKPKDAVELVLQDTALECRNDPRVMEQERRNAEEFLQKIRSGTI